MSAYNLLVHHGRLVLIDLPQVVDVIANPRGAEFLDRDAANVARWFTARGLAGAAPCPEDLAALLRREARLASDLGRQPVFDAQPGPPGRITRPAAVARTVPDGHRTALRRPWPARLTAPSRKSTSWSA